MQLGLMIGEVFVIRHDVNLHSEILDTPDFFWKEEHFTDVYSMVQAYLEAYTLLTLYPYILIPL